MQLEFNKIDIDILRYVYCAPEKDLTKDGYLTLGMIAYQVMRDTEIVKHHIIKNLFFVYGMKRKSMRDSKITLMTKIWIREEYDFIVRDVLAAAAKRGW